MQKMWQQLATQETARYYHYKCHLHSYIYYRRFLYALLCVVGFVCAFLSARNKQVSLVGRADIAAAQRRVVKVAKSVRLGCRKVLSSQLFFFCISSLFAAVLGRRNFYTLLLVKNIWKYFTRNDGSIYFYFL